MYLIAGLDSILINNNTYIHVTFYYIVMYMYYIRSRSANYV